MIKRLFAVILSQANHHTLISSILYGMIKTLSLVIISQANDHCMEYSNVVVDNRLTNYTETDIVVCKQRQLHTKV